MSSDALAGPEGAQRASILVVDDVPLFLELETLFLSRLGDVRTAASVGEARALVAAQVPDVVVLDQSLPDDTSDSFCFELRTQTETSHLPLVMIASGRSDDHARAVRAGADDVLAKPLTRAALVESVGRFVHDTTHPRGLPRVPIDRPVALYSDDRATVGTIRNLSRGGLFIEAEWDPAEGTEMKLEFELPDAVEWLRPTARLVWRRARADAGLPGLGVRFLELDGETARSLDSFVQERVPLDDVPAPTPNGGPTP